jgi:hypothetical protein
MGKTLTPAALGKMRAERFEAGKPSLSKALAKLTPTELKTYAKAAKITIQQARRDRARKPADPKVRAAAERIWKEMCSGEFSRQITYVELQKSLKKQFKKLVAVQTLSDWCKHIKKPTSVRKSVSNQPRYYHEYSLSQ